MNNREAIEAWNTVLFDKFQRFKRTLQHGLAAHGSQAMDRLAIPLGARVIDLGCGFGDTTLQLARRVGPNGRVLGIDAAARFIEAARQDMNGTANVAFEVADIEASVPGGPYDFAFSRMGMMFFASPVIALRNVRRVLAPSGRMSMIVWRKLDANECMHAAQRAVHELLGSPPKQDQVTCGPGPFSMASPDLVGDQLVAAGYTDITFTRCDLPLMIGTNLADAVAFALSLGPAGEIVRLAGQGAVARRAEIEAALARALEPFVRADGVWAPSSCWIVEARPS